MISRNLKPDQWRNTTWMVGVHTTKTLRNLEPEQWRNKTWIEGVKLP
jgi:hypothetical protein